MFQKASVSKNFVPKREISRFSKENFLSHSTNKFRNGTHLFFTKILVSRNFMNKRGGGWCHNLSSKLFFFHSTESFRRRNLLCFRKFRVSKSLMDKRGGGCSEGVSHLSAKNFLSHSSEKISSRNLILCH